MSLLGSRGATPIWPSPPRPTSYAKTLAAGATGFGIRVRELKAARHQCTGIVQLRTFEIERCLGIDDDLRVGRAHENIAAFRSRHEFHLIAQAVTAATRNRDPQKLSLRLAGDQRRDLAAGGGREVHEVLVTGTDALGQRGERSNFGSRR